MMKKYLFAFVLSALVLAACGKKEEPQTSAVTPAPAMGASAASSEAASAATQTSVVAAASSTAPMALDDEKVLNIYNWPDYIPDGMLQEFEKETGIKVNYDTFETNEALHAKLMAGSTGYDIVVPGAVFAKQQIEGGLLQPLDKNLLPNWSNLDPAVMQLLTKADPGNAYLVPWAWSFNTVGINKNKVAQALGDLPMPENAWDLVFDPKYTSKLKSCGIAYLDSPTEIIPAALHYIGKDAYSNDPADYQQATEMLAKVRKDIRIFSSTMIDDIVAGRACVVLSYAGDINIAAQRARENQSPDEIEALLPSIGVPIFIDNLAVTKDARHPKNAAAFINFYLRPENSALMSNEMGYSTANKAALPLIQPEIAANKSVVVAAEYLAKMVPPSSFSNEARAALSKAYTDFKKGQ